VVGDVPAVVGRRLIVCPGDVVVSEALGLDVDVYFG